MPWRFASTRGTRRAVSRFSGSEEGDAAAARDLDKLIASVDRACAWRFLPDLLARRAEVDLHSGQWDAARSRARTSIAVARETGQRCPYGLYVLALIEAAQGRELECRRHVAAVFLSLGVRDSLYYGDSVVGLLELGLGRVGAAIAHLEPLATESGQQAPPVVQWAPNLIEGYVRAGRFQEGESTCLLLIAEAERGDQHGTRAAAARCRGLLAGPDAYERAFRRALAWHDREADPFERARTELCFGERLRRSRRRTEARKRIASALAVFERLDAVPWANRAWSEFGGSSDGDSRRRAAPTDALTPGETHVAVLVASGYTNREAAASLFVSPKTVEFHLGQVYRKLGIRSRAELVGVWAGAGPDVQSPSPSGSSTSLRR